MIWNLPEIAGISFRPATEADTDFIFGLVRDTMKNYVLETYGNWDDHEQRRMTKARMHEHPPQIVIKNDNSIGELTVYEENGGLRIRQIYILPEHQNQKLGSMILEDFKAQSARNGCPIYLSVLSSNPAQKLYLRHGFRLTHKATDKLHFEYRP